MPPKPASETSPLKDPGGSGAGYTACGCIRIRERRTAVLVMLLVISWSIVAKGSVSVALESSLPALEKYNIGGMGSHLVAILPGTLAVFYAVGKGSQPILTFLLGGRNVLAYVEGLFGALSVLVITSGTPTFVICGAVGANYAMAHAWGATTNVG